MNSKNPGGHIFKQTGYIFVHIQNIIKTNILSKLHEDWTINFFTIIRKNAPPPGGHVFQPTRTIFELVQDIIGTIILVSKFHEDQTINVASRENAPPLGGHVFQATGTIFELVQDIIGTNLLAKVHDHRPINVASKVLKRFYYSYRMKNAPPPLRPYWTINLASKVITRKNARPLGSHVSQANVTILEIIQDII
ncbi:hypothetical protein DPMN_122376 [Dreissena polymorpha]|uniref:Uncharacterized protein n=1 Tax=Dreissena polymorpha TaxID=45954 RepID=A0A9D4GP98_DREPO|nr:hypothetical protein DPMN_122376 [Dreissena polymorpha]